MVFAVIWFIVSYVKCHFSLTAVKIFFSIFSSQQFDNDVSGTLSFVFWVYPLLALLSFLNLEIYVFHQIVWICGDYFSNNFFCTDHFPLSFWDPSDTHVRPSDVIPHVPEVLFNFSFAVFFLFFIPDRFYCSVFMLTDSFPLSSPFCCLAHLLNFLL